MPLLLQNELPQDHLSLLWLALAAAVLLVVLYSVTSLVRRGPEDTLFVAHVRFFAELFSWLIHGLRTEPAKEDPVPREGAAIVVANHRSGYDPVAIGLITRRRVRFLMAREYYLATGIHWMFRALDCVPVRRDGHDLGATKTALTHLRKGHVIGIFPQGGIRDPEDLTAAKNGVAMMALRSGAPIIPCHISGSPARESVFGALFTPSRTVVRPGKPLYLEGPAKGKPTREDLERLTGDILAAIAAQAPEGTNSTF